MAVMAVLALGTSPFAGAFTPGSVVVVRFGDGSQAVTNLGQTVFLDEYGTNALLANAGGSTPVTPTSIALPTTWVGNQAPLICSPPGTAAGFLTRSADGRFLVLAGFGGTFGQLTNQYLNKLDSIINTNGSFSGSSTTGRVTEADIPRVVGLVDGSGHIYTSTTLTNVSETGDDIRSAVSLDGTNIWVAGDNNKVKYTTRGSMLETQVCGTSSLSPLRALGLFGNRLYTDKSTALGYTTNTGPANLVGSLPTNVVPFADFGASLLSGEGITAFNLGNHHSGGAEPDTIYVCDAQTNFPGFPINQGGSALKYCYDSGTWVNYGQIGAEDAYGVAGYQNGANVTLFITEGTNNTLYTYTDTSGYDGFVYATAPNQPAYAPGSFTLLNTRGIAVAPVGGDSGTISGPGVITVGPPYGPYFRGPQGGPMLPSNGVAYSVANLGASSTNFTVTFSQFGVIGTWLQATPSSGTLNSGSFTTVLITPSSNSTNLTGGQSYQGYIQFRTGTLTGTGSLQMQANMTADALFLSPITNFVTSGDPGGPFSPSNEVFALSNATPAGLAFSAFTSNNWTTLTCPSAFQLSGNVVTGTVPAFSTFNITVTINSNANALENIGSYQDQLIVSNVSAATQLITAPKVLLQVGFGIFDDFSGYQTGDVAGQNNWGGNPDNINHVQITNGVYSVPGGCPNAGGTSQQPSKYVANGPVTNAYDALSNNVPTYAILGMSIVFTNGSPSPNYTFGMGSAFLTWCDSGVMNSGGGYKWTSEINAYNTGGGNQGTATYSFGTRYQVFLMADFVNSNTYVFVNPPGPPSGYSNATDLVNWSDGSVIDTADLAVHGDGSGCSYCPGASDQGWNSVIVGQYSACPGETQQGYNITRLAASTNYTLVWKWLNSPAAASFTAAPTNGAPPLTVQFTDTTTGGPTVWNWAFGDGGVSTNQSPVYTYNTAGTWTVQLIASNSVGWSTNSAVITVGSAVAGFAAWQAAYFPGGGTLSPAGVDAYGTGMSNTNKFLAGFNGTNKAAYLRITSVAKQNGTNVVVTFLGSNGDSGYTGGPSSRANVLDYTTGTANGSYTNNWPSATQAVQTNILSGGNGNGTISSFTDVGGASPGPTRYYRVRVLVP
jgi:PKD repeat protein